MATIIEKHKPSKDSRILDVAAGTGIMGEKLRELGYHEIDALDPVQEMLDEAKSKGLYKNYICEAIEVGKASQIQNDTYDVICCFGGHGVGHLTPECWPLLIGMLKPGGVFIFSFSKKQYKWHDHPAFHDVRGKLQSFIDNKVCSKWTEQEVTNYSSDGQKADLFVITKA